MLYNTSYSWRALAVQFFLNKITLNISICKGIGKFKFYMLPDEINIDTTNYNYVKRVNIKISDIEYPADRNECSDFSAAWPENLVFYSASHLSINLSGLLYQKIDEHNTNQDERCFWILQRIQTSMPKLQEVEISDYGVKLPNEKKWKADKFLSAIFSKATIFNIKVDVVHLTSDHSFFQQYTRVTCLEFYAYAENAFVRCLFAKCAPTLVLLKFIDEHLLNVRSLIFDEKDKSIVYPRLERLAFHSFRTAKISRKIQVDESIAIFPVLQYLRWSASYIFTDDTPFRGNCGTLEYLDIELDPNTADILQRYRMFANGKYSRLRYISVLNDENRSNVQLSPIRFIKFLMSLITPTTEFLAFSNHPLDMDSIGIISIGPYLGGIQVLNLENTRVKLPELIALIKLLSNMIRLICQPATTIFEPDSVQLSDHINELHAQNHPLNHRLKHWEVVLGFRYEAQHVASTALALAVLCTNFVLAFAPFKHRKEFERDIKTAIDSNLYNEHKSKIQRLFHNMD